MDLGYPSKTSRRMNTLLKHILYLSCCWPSFFKFYWPSVCWPTFMGYFYFEYEYEGTAITHKLFLTYVILLKWMCFTQKFCKFHIFLGNRFCILQYSTFLVAPFYMTLILINLWFIYHYFTLPALNYCLTYIVVLSNFFFIYYCHILFWSCKFVKILILYILKICFCKDFLQLRIFSCIYI